MNKRDLEVDLRFKLANIYCDEDIPFKDLDLKITIGNKEVEKDVFLEIVKNLIDYKFEELKSDLKTKINKDINNLLENYKGVD